MDGIDTLHEIVSEIIIEADKLKNKVRDDHEDGQLLAYAEALSIIQSAAAYIDLDKIGLDFDVDKRYF